MSDATITKRGRGRPRGPAPGPKADPKVKPTNLTRRAWEIASIASGYTGESLVGWVSRIVVERGQADIDRYHAEYAAARAKNGAGK